LFKGTAVRNSEGSNRGRFNNTDQNIDGVHVIAQRAQPLLPGGGCDNFFDDRLSQDFLAAEVVMEGSFSDSSGGKDGVDAGTLEA